MDGGVRPRLAPKYNMCDTVLGFCQTQRSPYNRHRHASPQELITVFDELQATQGYRTLESTYAQRMRDMSTRKSLDSYIAAAPKGSTVFGGVESSRMHRWLSMPSTGHGVVHELPDAKSSPRSLRHVLP
jgi:hypothetical protein